jgi:hypothetical protein
LAAANPNGQAEYFVIISLVAFLTSLPTWYSVVGSIAPADHIVVSQKAP